MSLKLRNRWNYKGGDWWEWEVFLDDGGSGELGNVDHVEYVLHPTFPSPVRQVSVPEGGFALKTSGWGTFQLKAFVYTKDGKKQKIMKELQLHRDPPTGTSN